MNRVLSILVSTILMFYIVSCEETPQNKISNDPSTLVSKFGGVLTSGSVKFQTSKVSEIVVTQDFLEDNENSVERIYVLGLESNIGDTFSDVSFEKADVINIKDKALLLHSEDGMWIILSVNNEISKKLKNDLIEFLGKDEVYTFEGAYISFIGGKYDLPESFLKHQESVFNGLEKYSRNFQELQKSSTIKDKDGISLLQDGGGDEVDICTKKCSSGGPGSTECSTTITIGPWTSTCSVTAGDGYYACCNNYYNKCKACKNAPNQE